MQRILLASRVLLGAALLPSLIACSWLNSAFPDRSKDYKKAETTRSLEVPPDLTATAATDALVVPEGETTLSGYTSARETLVRSGTVPVLPGQEGMQLERHRDRTWLVVDGEPRAVWAKAREFWLENGFLIVREDPAIGVLETDWVENRDYLPQGAIRGLISRVWEGAYTSAYQDRYRMRLEVGERPGTTELFVSHQGVEEVAQGTADSTQTYVWTPRPRDPGLESEMLKRLMIYMGVAPQQAEQQLAQKQKEPQEAQAELIQQESGDAVLVVHEGFPRAWRSVGITLDRVDFAVEDRDRSSGIYYVRYNDPLKGEKKGVLSKLAFWSDDEEQVVTYQIKLSDDGANTRVVVLNAAGEPEKSVTAVRILTLLYEELR